MVISAYILDTFGMFAFSLHNGLCIATEENHDLINYIFHADCVLSLIPFGHSNLKPDIWPEWFSEKRFLRLKLMCSKMR